MTMAIILKLDVLGKSLDMDISKMINSLVECQMVQKNVYTIFKLLKKLE